MKWVTWLRGLAEKGGKGVVNNIDARCLGRMADDFEALTHENERLLKEAAYLRAILRGKATRTKDAPEQHDA